MIVLNVTYKCKPGKRDGFLARINEEGIGAACRAEAGNVKYHYYIPELDSDELFLLEKWQDIESLTAHTKQPHFARLGEIKDDYVEDTILEKYEV